jgi:hypothetical protein
MININSALSSLNSNYSFVTDVVPDLFYFSDEPEVSELGTTYSNSIAIQDDYPAWNKSGRTNKFAKLMMIDQSDYNT